MSVLGSITTTTKSITAGMMMNRSRPNDDNDVGGVNSISQHPIQTQSSVQQQQQQQQQIQQRKIQEEQRDEQRLRRTTMKRLEKYMILMNHNNNNNATTISTESVPTKNLLKLATTTMKYNPLSNNSNHSHNKSSTRSTNGCSNIKDETRQFLFHVMDQIWKDCHTIACTPVVPPNNLLYDYEPPLSQPQQSIPQQGGFTKNDKTTTTTTIVPKNLNTDAMKALGFPSNIPMTTFDYWSSSSSSSSSDDDEDNDHKDDNNQNTPQNRHFRNKNNILKNRQKQQQKQQNQNHQDHMIRYAAQRGWNLGAQETNDNDVDNDNDQQHDHNMYRLHVQNGKSNQQHNHDYNDNAEEDYDDNDSFENDGDENESILHLDNDDFGGLDQDQDQNDQKQQRKSLYHPLRFRKKHHAQEQAQNQQQPVQPTTKITTTTTSRIRKRNRGGGEDSANQKKILNRTSLNSTTAAGSNSRNLLTKWMKRTEEKRLSTTPPKHNNSNSNNNNNNNNMNTTTIRNKKHVTFLGDIEHEDDDDHQYYQEEQQQQEDGGSTSMMSLQERLYRTIHTITSQQQHQHQQQSFKNHPYPTMNTAMTNTTSMTSEAWICGVCGNAYTNEKSATQHEYQHIYDIIKELRYNKNNSMNTNTITNTISNGNNNKTTTTNNNSNDMQHRKDPLDPYQKNNTTFVRKGRNIPSKIIDFDATPLRSNVQDVSNKKGNTTMQQQQQQQQQQQELLQTESALPQHHHLLQKQQKENRTGRSTIDDHYHDDEFPGLDADIPNLPGTPVHQVRANGGDGTGYIDTSGGGGMGDHNSKNNENDYLIPSQLLIRNNGRQIQSYDNNENNNGGPRMIIKNPIRTLDNNNGRSPLREEGIVSGLVDPLLGDYSPPIGQQRKDLFPTAGATSSTTSYNDFRLLDETDGQDVMLLSSEMKNHLIRSDEALLYVMKIAEPMLLRKIEYEAEYELHLLALDKCYYDDIAYRSVAREKNPTNRYRSDNENTMGKIQNKLLDAYQLMKECDTNGIQNGIGKGLHDQYNIKKNKKRILHNTTTKENDKDGTRTKTRTKNSNENHNEEDDDVVLNNTNQTLYVNVMVKNSIQVVKYELERLAKQRWDTTTTTTTSNTNNNNNTTGTTNKSNNNNNNNGLNIQQQQPSKFERFRGFAQMNMVKLAGIALASDFTPRRIAIQLSNDLYRLLTPRLKRRGITITTEIEYRVGPYFVLAINIENIDWQRLIKATYRDVARRKSRWRNESKGSEPTEHTDGDTKLWLRVIRYVKMAYSVTTFDFLTELFSLLYHTHWLIYIPVCLFFYHTFLGSAIRHFIINSVTDEIFFYVEQKGMEMEIKICRADKQTAFMLSALREIRADGKELQKKQQETASHEKGKILGPYLGPAIKDDKLVPPTKPIDFEIPANLEFVGLELDLPVGYRRLRWAMLSEKSQFITEVLYKIEAKYEKITLGSWDKCSEYIGEPNVPDTVNVNDFIGAEKENEYLMPKSAFVSANMCYEKHYLLAYNDYCFCLKKRSRNPDAPFGNSFIAWTQYVIINTGNDSCKLICSVEPEFPNGPPMVSRQIRSGMRAGTGELFVLLGETIAKYADEYP